MQITRNRFADFYERCATDPQSMKQEMLWIRGKYSHAWSEPVRTVEPQFHAPSLVPVGDIGCIDMPERARTCQDVPDLPFPQTMQYERYIDSAEFKPVAKWGYHFMWWGTAVLYLEVYAAGVMGLWG